MSDWIIDYWEFNGRLPRTTQYAKSAKELVDAKPLVTRLEEQLKQVERQKGGFDFKN